MDFWQYFIRNNTTTEAGNALPFWGQGFAFRSLRIARFSAFLGVTALEFLRVDGVEEFDTSGMIFNSLCCTCYIQFLLPALLHR